METNTTDRHARWIDITKDLNSVADLLAVAFADRLDADGEAALRQLRRIARSRSAQRTYRSSEIPGSPLYGFVWEEDGRIVGNVSLIPLETKPKQYLIVNVAVHPLYRRRGIARVLMERTLAYARQKHVGALWLQVETQNQGAIALYRDLGFKALDTVTVWDADPRQHPEITAVAAPRLRVRAGRVRRSEWAQQRAWLEATYPADRVWHFPCRRWDMLAPTWKGMLMRLLTPPSPPQWVARRAGALVGAAIWLPRPSGAMDAVMLAAPPNIAAPDLAVLLAPLRKRARRPLRAELPQGFLADALTFAGFQPNRHLLWMKWTP